MSFFTDEAAVQADLVKVSAYMASEFAKKLQKVPPERFVVSPQPRYWGVYGSQGGFVPVVEEFKVPVVVARWLERVLVRWVHLRQISNRRRRGLGDGGGMARRLVGQGVTAFMLDVDKERRALRAAERLALKGMPDWGTSQGPGGVAERSDRSSASRVFDEEGELIENGAGVQGAEPPGRITSGPGAAVTR